MQKLNFRLCGKSTIFAISFCLLTLGLAPWAWANTTPAPIATRHRQHRVHGPGYRTTASSHRRRTLSASRHRTITVSSTGGAHPATGRRRALLARRRTHARRRTGAATHTQRHRLAAELDRVKTQPTPLAEESAAIKDASAPLGSQTLDSQTTIAGPMARIAPRESNWTDGSIPSPVNENRQNIPVFNLTVPRIMPIALRGSHEVLVHQNIIADVEGLGRIQNDAQLRAMVHSGDLVPLPASPVLNVDGRLPFNRRYCRPWTAKFLSDLSAAHSSVFGRPLQLTSAVRTVDFQRHLARYNGNAAPAFGDTASPHLTGQAIDIGKKGMTQHEIAWMREVLGQLQNSGKLDVEEEFEQACFHISVYKTYAPHSTPPARLVAHQDGAPPSEGVTTAPAIGGLARPVRAVAYTHPHSSSYAAHTVHLVRRTAVHRRRRRHHTSMSLLAARMR